MASTQPSPSSSRSLRDRLGEFAARHQASLIAGAVGLALLGLLLRGIFYFGGDLPAGTAWLEAIADSAGPKTPSGVLARAVIALNGAWEPTLVLLGGAVVFAFAWAVLVHGLVTRLSRPGGWLLGAAAVGLGGLLASHGQPWQTLSSAPLGLLLAIAQLRLGSDPLRRTSYRAGSLLAGLAGCFVGPLGLLASITLLLVALRDRITATPIQRLDAQRWLMHSTLLVILNAIVASIGTGLPFDIARLGDPLTWLTALPLLWFIAHKARTSSRLLALAFWVVLLRLTSSETLASGTLHVVTLVTGLACLLAPEFDAVPLARRVLAGGLWAIIAFNLLWHSDVLHPAELPATPDLPRMAAVRQYLGEHDPASLRTAFALDEAAGKHTATLLADLSVTARLPAAARAPLALVPTVGDAAFPATRSLPYANTPPGLTLRTNLPSKQAGEFASAFVSSEFPVLNLYAAGQLAPPRTQLFLRTKSGLEIAPLQTSFASPDRWRRVNFDNPGEPFQLVARSTDGTTLAFSDFVESGRASWLAGKFLTTWPVWLAVGGLLLVLTGLPLTAELRVVPSALPIEIARWIPWLAVIAVVTFVAFHLDVYAGGSDSSGYLNSARLLDEGRLTASIPRAAVPALETMSSAAYIPWGFAPHGSAEMAPTYPVGLPLFIALANLIFPGASALAVVILAHLVLAALVTRELARALGLPIAWAWGAAFWVLLCPVTLFMGLQPMSDVPALVWSTAAVVAALRSRASASRADAWALAAGFLTALAVLIRPSNALIALPAALALGASPRRLALWCVGGLPGAALLGWYNYHLYGSPFVTGYGSLEGIFGANWIAPTLMHYAKWLPLLLTPLIGCAVAFPFLRSVVFSVRAALVSWLVVYLAFYACYYCTHETWWYLRFILPVLPPLVAMATVTINWIHIRLPRLKVPVFVGASVTLWLLIAGAQLNVLDSGRGNRPYADASHWLDAHAPQNSLVLAGQTRGALLYYSRVKFIWPDNAAETARLAATVRQENIPLYAELFPYELARLRDYPGTWEQVAGFDAITLWRWHAP